MKTILCYGDSLTWGTDAASGGRHPRRDRWPHVLAGALAGDAEVIVDGLRGRTTAFDDHSAECDRNGARILPTVLYTHAPLDLVILMLGTNDMKPHLAGTAVAAMQGMRRLVEIVRGASLRDGTGDAPGVLVVAPPPLCGTANTEFSALFAGGVAESAMLASFYSEMAQDMGVDFFDAASVARTTPVDGVHMDAENTRTFGRALAPIVKLVLGL